MSELRGVEPDALPVIGGAVRFGCILVVRGQSVGQFLKTPAVICSPFRTRLAMVFGSIEMPVSSLIARFGPS